MILAIDDDYRLTADSRSWSIQKRRKRRNKYEWESILWYQSLAGAIEELDELGLRTSDAKTLSDALDAVKRTHVTLSKALDPDFQVTESTPGATDAARRVETETEG